MQMHLRSLAAALRALMVFAAAATPSFAALASKTTGKAVTSANLSTNPTVRQQQLLVDPSGPDEPLILTYAKLDVMIHLDTPLGFTAQDIIRSIQVTALAPHFFPVGQMPFYVQDGGALGVTFEGRDVTIHDFTVQWNTDNPPPPGEVDHAIVDVQYNNVLPKGIYDNVLATFTVKPSTLSEIRGRGAETNELFTFGPDNIIPAADVEPLGVPEPATIGAVMLVGAVSLMRRRSR
jgi:hypothetical protein